MSDLPPPPPPPPPADGRPPTGFGVGPGSPPPGYGYPPPGWGTPGYAPPPGSPAAGWTWAGQAPLPGSGRFRAQGVGQLLDSGFTLYRRNVALIVAITAVAQVPLALVTYVVYQLTGVSQATAELQQLSTSNLTSQQQTQAFQALLPTFTALFIVLVVVALLQALVVQPVATAAMTRAVSDIYLERPVTMGAAYRAVMARIWSVLGVAGLLVLVFGGLLAGTAGLLVLAVLALGAGGVVLWIVILPAAGVAVVFLYARWLFAAPVVILEGRRATDAMARSWNLVRGSTMRVLGISALVSLIAGILGAIISGLLSLVTQFGDANVQLVLSQLARLIAAVAIQPIAFIVVVLLYYDQRIRREAFDIEMLAATL